MEHSFQINLLGIINLLSDHLYSGPQVYVRELLQNSVDAIRARELIEPNFGAHIEVELIYKTNEPPMLVIEDNGIGLTEAEIHKFLSVIGQSSKTDQLVAARQEFIGQFGIGLLSCFMVSDEILVITRSARPGEEGTYQWCGSPDGKYRVEKTERRHKPGTTVILRGKQTAMQNELLAEHTVINIAHKYGAMLPFPIFIGTADKKQQINALTPPWRSSLPPGQQQRAYIEFGEGLLANKFLDAIPLSSPDGGISGAAFVLLEAHHHSARTQHRVYLKNMLLSESAENILPEWAFFVKCVINADNLRPTASREDFYEDEMLLKARANLGKCLIDYLSQLAETEPRKLQGIIKLHHLAMKALALENDEFYSIIIDFLPFETTFGSITLGEYKKHNQTLRYVAGLDLYRQVSQVAAAQSMWLINAGYVYDTELLIKHQYLFPLIATETVDGNTLSHEFTELGTRERETSQTFLATAKQVLSAFKCSASIKTFLPCELPVLYILDENNHYLRSIDQSKSVADSLWAGVLDNLGHQVEKTQTHICFNFNNLLVQKLMAINDDQLLAMSIRMLYIQALLLGHHPLNAAEMKVLNSGFGELIEWGIQKDKEASTWTRDPKSLN